MMKRTIGTFGKTVARLFRTAIKFGGRVFGRIASFALSCAERVAKCIGRLALKGTGKLAKGTVKSTGRLAKKTGSLLWQILLLVLQLIAVLLPAALIVIVAAYCLNPENEMLSRRSRSFSAKQLFHR